MIELLTLCGRSLPHVMMMLIPEAWAKNELMDPALRAEQWQHAMHLARTLSQTELLTLDHETVLHRLYHEEALRLFDPRPVHYQCSCSRERTARALLAIGQAEVDSIVAEQGGVAISCEFCGTEYNFGPGEIDQLFDKGDSVH